MRIIFITGVVKKTITLNFDEIALPKYNITNDNIGVIDNKTDSLDKLLRWLLFCQ